MKLTTTPEASRQTATTTVVGSVCFIVPTLKRPDFLRRCLTSILRQTMQPRRVLVGVRVDDDPSRKVLDDIHSYLPVIAVAAEGIGVIGSMSSSLGQATEDFVALLDDDMELPPHWLEKMMEHLATNPDVLGAAGRDLLQDKPEARSRERRTLDVGRFHWYGKMTGNHHRGMGLARRVDILRGSNCLFRGGFLREVGFEQRLRGNGAQVNWELALALHARLRDKRLFYDPGVEVIHHVAPRDDSDQLHRGRFSSEALSDVAYNEAFILHSYAPMWMRVMTTAWTFLRGGGLAPGLIKCMHILWRREPYLGTRIAAFLSGWIAGWRDASRFRQTTKSLR